ncbi:MAG: HlyC/CorC family transporter [Chloroflexi bacterium]|nr:HlyC/CorC family transporter [Chloroflexota bacterium]
MDTVIVRLLGVLFLLLMNGFFVAVEFAAVSARRSRIDQQAESGAVGARRAQRMLGDTDRVLAASQLGITMASLALGWVGEPFVADLIEPPLSGLPIGQWVSVKDVAHAASAVIAFTAITALHIVIGEQAPKVWAIRNAERVITMASVPMIAFDRLFRPFIYVLDHATEWVLKLFGTQPISGHRVYHSVEELKQLVSDSQEGGVLEASEEEMIHNVFEFADRQVSEAMVPRPDIAGLEATATLNEFLTLFSESHFSRYPLYEGDLDNIIGFVTIKDVLNFLASEGPAARQQPAVQLMRPAMHVPEFKQVGDLFEEMKTQGISLAVIVDEYGGTAGIVTQGGILEVLVGRLRDEAEDDEPEVSQLDELTAEVDAQLRIEEVNEELKTDLPEHDAYETLAGLILFQLQRIPASGERLTIGAVQLTIKEMQGAKIEKVEVKRTDPAPAAKTGDEQVVASRLTRES